MADESSQRAADAADPRPGAGSPGERSPEPSAAGRAGPGFTAEDAAGSSARASAPPDVASLPPPAGSSAGAGEPASGDGPATADDTLHGPLASLREEPRDLAAQAAFASVSRRLFGGAIPQPRLGVYTLERALGHGGMGVVHEATGPHGERVALKSLRALHPAGIERLKHEFRSVADLLHPNLVALHELVHDAARDEWFIVMDLVPGVGLREHLRAAEHGEAALRAVFVQLVRGVHALHRAGQLHRDLKPSNVLVTPEGRVVLLDFGLIRGPGDSGDEGVAGTPAYMSPEQARGEAIGPASDWYSLGLLLFEALAERALSTLPGETDPRRRARAPDVAALLPTAPPALASLCAALLAPRPEQRPDVRAVLRALGHGLDDDDPGSVPLLGRAGELARLTAATRHERPTVVLVEGRSGVGKTALLDAFLRERDVLGDLVLRGRCYERESVPYKAVDGLIDALTRLLRTWPAGPPRPPLPDEFPALTRVFPVLARLAPAAPPTDTADPHETRRLAFRALKQLLAQLARARPLVLAIDDLQWGDLDSARLVLELLAPPDAPACLWIFTCRREDRDAPFLAELARAGVALREVAVEPLASDAAEALAQALLRARGEEPDAALTRAIAGESGGSPLFVEALIRQRPAAGRPISLDRALLAALEHTSPLAQDLLALSAVAGQPLARGLLRAAAVTHEGERAALQLLRARHLLRSNSSGGAGDDDLVVPYHDRIREVVLRNLAPAVLRDLHRRLATAFAATLDPDPERLAFHWHGAGDDPRAGPYAAEAADRAFAALAFERAATLYARALAWTPGLARARTLALTLREAESLTHAGRCGDAAPRYLDAAALTDRAGALELRRKAAEQYLISGRVAEGLAVLRPLARDQSLPFPETPRRALVRLALGDLALHLRGFGAAPRPGAPLTPEQALRLDTCWSAAKGLSFIDPVRAATFASEGLRGSLAAGDPLRIARSLAHHALLDVNLGEPRLAASGAARIARAHQLALGTGDSYTLGVTTIMGGVAELNSGRWRRGITGVEAGVALLGERCVGVTWERSIARAMAMHARTMLGELTTLGPHASAWLREAEELGDRFASVVAGLYLGHGRLADGDVAGARQAAAQARARWTTGGFHFQHWLALGLEVACELADGQPRAAWDRLARAWPEIDRSLLLRIQLPRIDTRTMRATVALALAPLSHDPSDRRALLRTVDADADALAREHLGHARAAATLLRGGLAALRGDRAAQLAACTAAEAGFGASDMPVHAACVRRRLASLRGEGPDEADATLRSHGVRDPAAFAATHVA